MTLWEILKANKTGIAPDMFTMLAASKMNGGRDRLHELSGIPPLSFTAKGKPLTAWSITGNTVQNGTPTPENPVEVQAVGDRTGNLFDINRFAYIGEGVYSIDDTTVTMKGNSQANIYYLTWQEYEAGTYTFTFERDTTLSCYYVIASDFSLDNCLLDGDYLLMNAAIALKFNKSYAGYRQTTKRSFTITSYVPFYFAIAPSHSDYTISNIMLNSGSTALPYEPYGYKIPVVTRGKNLIDVANLTGKTDTLFTDNINPKLAQVKFDEATQYTISMKFEIDTSIGWRKITFTYTDGTTSVSPWITKIGVFKYTSTSGKTISKVEFTNYNYFGDVYVEYIQLESGTTATPYEPYHEPITTPIYLDAPLYKIGDYADRLSKTEEVRVVKELVLTGKEKIDYNKLSGNSRFTVNNAFQTADYHIGICSHYKYEFVNANNTVYHTSSNMASVIFIFDNNYTSVADFKAYLADQYAAGTPVKVYYVMQTPETKTVEPVEIPTLNGTTVIDVDTAVKPESMTIKYRK